MESDQHGRSGAGAEGIQEIIAYVRQGLPCGEMTDDELGEGIRRMVNDPLFLSLLMYFSADADRDAKKKAGAKGGETRSRALEGKREKARKYWRDQGHKEHKTKAVAEMMIRSTLSINTVRKLIAELQKETQESK